MNRTTNTILQGFIFRSALLVFFISLLCNFSSSYSQNWSMPVDGKVMAGQQKATGAIVTLYKNGQQLQQIVTTSNGKFSFELTPNAEYLIAVTKPGYVTKKFKIVTANVPADRAEAGNFNPFEPDVSLFEMPTAPEVAKRVEAILSAPIAIYQYIPGENNFNYDEKYTESIQQKLAELAELQKQVEKEQQEKAKNAALEAQKQLEIDTKYKAAIAKADKAFGSADYANAKLSYTEASNVKPTEPYPKQKLAEIEKLLSNANAQKELDVKYKAAIAKADGAFNAKDYALAKTSYTEASGLKPAEAYPKQKLAEIDKLLGDLAKQKEIDEKYKAAVAKGDGAFGSKDYPSAKTSYTEAAGLKPAEAYPKQKLAEIDKLLGDLSKQKEIDEKYKAAIAKGDGAFGSKDYPSAKTSYTEASGLKPAEAYPKQKLAEIDKLLGDLAKQKDIEDKYKAAVAKGDGAFGSKDYPSAKTSYTEASGLKPAEAYPKQKLAEIEKLLAGAAAAAKQKELDEKYKAAVAKGDNAFGTKDYSNARSAYSEASGIKPNEAYPKQKIAEIDKLLGALEADKQKEQQYKDAVAKADAAFASKDYAGAKTSYTLASGIKPAEQYPKTKLAEIDKLLAEMAKAGELDKKYKDLIAKADNLFSQKNYPSAKSSYSDASSLKPAEAYPKQKIAEIDKILADLDSQKSAAEKEQKYKDAIAKADKLFAAKDYSNSKTSYNDALAVKPTEPYPKQKIAEIDKILADLDAAKSAADKQKELDAKYKAAIAKADAAFTSKEYAAAKTSYTDASGIKPAEQYPKTRLAEIEKILADLAAKNASDKTLNDNYQSAITRGDLAFNSKTYANAKAAFNEALTYKPNEPYPKQKLAEIEKLEKGLADAAAQKERENNYAIAIGKADDFFKMKNYPAARTNYQQASDIKPEEKYPKEKLKQIEDIIKASQLAQNTKKETKQAPPPVNVEEKKKQYVSELRAKYPIGVTEEEFNDNGKTVLRRVVISEEDAAVYTKVTHNWGGVYCYKDNEPISEVAFENESK
ncbi:MAG: hypothetical protein HY063_11770 [Bacteroidetes bacterium]|nr:hypothetical protein [Bacteroidota bacterium]